MARFGSLDSQYFDDAGDPLVSGKIWFYESGTTTPKTTYADTNLSIPNTNPVILTASGRQPNIFFNGVAKAILTDADDVQIRALDPVGETQSTFGDAWIPTKRYSAQDVVSGTDGQFYVSLVSDNIGNDPTTSTGFWDFLYSVEWNPGITYKEGSVVTYDAILYQSLQDANLNKNPTSEAAWWIAISIAWVSTVTYPAGATVIASDGAFYVSLVGANTGNDPISSPGEWGQSIPLQASDAQIWAAAGTGYISPSTTASALEWQTLADAATIAVDWEDFGLTEVVMEGNRTLGNPTNVVPGLTKYILLKGNNATDRTLTFDTAYKGDLPILTDIDSGRWYLLGLIPYTISHIIVSWVRAL